MLRTRFALLLPVLALVGASCRPAAGPASPAALPPAAELELDETRMFANLEGFADDQRNGRYSGDPVAILSAARFLAKEHREAGLEMAGDSYLIDFDLVTGRQPGKTFHVWAQQDEESVAVDPAGLLGVSFGSSRAAFGGTVLVLGSPSDTVENQIALLVDVPTDHLDHLAARLSAVKAAGGRGAVVVGREGAALPGDEAARSALGDVELPTVWTTPAALATWLPSDTLKEVRGLAEQSADKTAALSGLRVSLARADEEVIARVPNVVAVLPGTDLANELVVLGAHYDHIGTKAKGTFCRSAGDDDDDKSDTICNGADDNASGTVAVLAIARAMRLAGYKPRRTIVFAHFAGEELGLRGSKALANHPPDVAPFNAGKVVAMLNMDMIGRLGDKGVEVGGIPTSEAWGAMVRDATPAGLEVHPTEAMTGRSDHASYNALGIPVLFFFTGLHPQYHTTADELALLNLDGVTSIAELVMGVARRLGDGAAV